MRVRQVTGSGCPPAFGYSQRKRPHCDRHVERMVAAMAELLPTTAILTAFYLQWHQSDMKEEFWAGLEGVVEALRKAGHDVIILGGVPGNPDGRMPEALSKWLMTGRSAESYGFKFDAGELGDVDRRIQRIAARKDAEYIPVQRFVSGASIESGWCNALNDGVVINFDEDHLTKTMARRVVRELILPRLIKGRLRAVD
jgi:hypothetical protein